MSATSLDGSALDAARMKRELDITINQRLNAQFTDRDTMNSRQDHYRNSITMISNDISSFARFLTHSFCLEVLLFWKEVEQYKSLFSPEERGATFMKIYEMYCEPGAPWQVNFKGQYFKEIEAAKKAGGDIGNVDEDVFDAAQTEVYELMRLDLFPRFCEHLEGANQDVTAEARADSIKEVLSGTNPPATRSFTRFAREQMCEEALLFWIEANDFALLFMPMDLETRSLAIYDTYMSSKAKYKISVKDSLVKDVHAKIEGKEVSNAMFLPAQQECALFLEGDLFPRYEKWWEDEEAKVAATRKRPTAGGESANRGSDVLGDRDAMRAATAAILNDKSKSEEVVSLREVAHDLDADENIEFYIDVRKYALLFTEQDRRETAARLYNRYVDPKADRLVTLPDAVTRQLTQDIVEKNTDDATVFAQAEKETLNLITDNIYPVYIKRKVSRSNNPSTVATPRGAPAKGGGCCTIL